MKKVRKFRLVALLLVVSMLFAGCSSNSTGGNAPATTGESTEVIRWTMQSSWPSGLLLHEMAERWAEEVKITSGGRLIIDVLPAGSLVGGAEVMDATHTRTIDAYHSVSTYWMGKMPAAPFFCTIPMSFEAPMYLVWLYERGGLELWQRMYDEANVNVKVLPGGVFGAEIIAHSHKPLSNLDDWKGLKYRTVGWWAEILKEMNVSVTTLPAAELYTSLDRRVIDAVEFGPPLINRELGFHEITNYFTGPGMNQPSTLMEIGINKDSWNALPEDLQQSLEIASRSMTLWGWTKELSGSIDTLEFYKSIGKTPSLVNEEAQREFRNTTWAYLDREAEKDEFFKEVWDSVKEFWTLFNEYEEFMIPVRK